jgi:hypothetical protein
LTLRDGLAYLALAATPHAPLSAVWFNDSVSAEAFMITIRHTLRVLAVLALAVGSNACEDSPSGPDNSPLTKEEIDAVARPTLAQFAEAYELVLQAHPDVPQESWAFARLLLEQIDSMTSQSNSVGVANAFGLNDAESDLLWTPFNWVHGLPTNRARNLAVAGAQAMGGDQEDDQADAFRHTYWNALMAKCCGVAWARDFANAHESNTSAGDALTMDLNNNAIGRAIYAANSSLSDAGLADKIKAYPVSCVDEGVTANAARIVYIEKCPIIRVYDDGPDFDDVYEVRLGSTTLGTTPKGSGTLFTTSDVVSGEHPLAVRCTLDGTQGGCGFKVELQQGIQFTDKTTATPQQVVQQGGSLTLAIVYPTLSGPAQDRSSSAAYAAPAALPVPGRRP